MKAKILDEIKLLATEYEYRYITERVLNKSIEVINKIDDVFFKENTEAYATPYKTLVLDFFKGKNELSLEIGYKQLGYFICGDFDKMVEFMDIESNDDINLAVKEIENDLSRLFNN